MRTRRKVPQQTENISGHSPVGTTSSTVRSQISYDTDSGGDGVTPPRRGPTRLSRWPTGTIFALLISVISVQTWFTPGRFVAAGDVGPFLRQRAGWDWLSLWNHRVAGTGAGSYEIARAPEILFGKLVVILGGSDMLAERLWFSFVMMIVVAAVCWLLGAFTTRQTAIAAGGLSVALSPFYLVNLPNLLPMMTIGAIAGVSGLIVRTGTGRRFRGWYMAAILALSSELVFNPPLLVIFILGVLCCLGLTLLFQKARRRQVLSLFVRSAPWVVLCNAWWLIPTVLVYLGHNPGLRVVAVTNVNDWAWTQRNSGIANVLGGIAHWSWGLPLYHPYSVELSTPWWSWMRFALPGVACCAPFFLTGTRRKLSLWLLGVVAGLVFLGKGINAPLGSINLLAYRVIPGFWLFRQPAAKFGVLLVVAFAVLVTLTIDGYLQQRSKLHVWLRHAAELGFVVCLVAAVAFVHPLWTGAVTPTHRPTLPSTRVLVPQTWRDLGHVINTNSSPGKVLSLPLDDYYQVATTWGYYGVDDVLTDLVTRPVVQQLPGGYYDNPAGVTSLLNASETSLAYDNTTAAQRLLSALNIGIVTIRHDLDRKVMAGRTFADDRALEAGIAAVPGAVHIYHSADVDAYQIPAQPRVQADTAPVVADTTAADGIAALVAAAPSGQALLSASTLTTGLETGTVPLVGRPANTNPQPTVYWDTPGGQRSLVFNAVGGAYSVATLDRGPVLYRATVTGHTLQLASATGVTVGGDPLTNRPNITIPYPGTAEALNIGGTIIPLVGAPLVSIAPNTTIGIYGNHGTGWTLNTHSAAGDCNNKSHATPATNGLTSTPLAGGIQLTARQDSACVSVPISGSGGVYAVNFQYRNLTGKPARICLYESTTNSCASAPSLNGTTSTPKATPAKATPVTAWQSYTQLINVHEHPGRLALYLYADGGARVPTVVQYQHVAIGELAPLTSATVTPSPRPLALVHTKAGPTSMSLTGGAANVNVLNAFGPVGDCDKIDQRTPAQAGLSASLFAGYGSRQLEATAHSACVAASLKIPGGVTQIEIAFDYRTVLGRTARICLFQVSANACVSTPALDATPGWHSTRFVTSLQRADGVVASDNTRLVLYADGNGAKRGTITQYKNISAHIATPFVVSGVAEPAEPTSAMSSAVVGNDTHWHATVAGQGPLVAVLNESSAAGWSIQGPRSSTPVMVDGYANGWLIPSLPGPTALSMQYQPSRIATLGLWLSLIGFLGIMLSLGQAGRKRLQKRRRVLP